MICDEMPIERKAQKSRQKRKVRDTSENNDTRTVCPPRPNQSSQNLQTTICKEEFSPDSVHSVPLHNPSFDERMKNTFHNNAYLTTFTAIMSGRCPTIVKISEHQILAFVQRSRPLSSEVCFFPLDASSKTLCGTHAHTKNIEFHRFANARSSPRSHESRENAMAKSAMQYLHEPNNAPPFWSPCCPFANRGAPCALLAVPNSVGRFTVLVVTRERSGRIECSRHVRNDQGDLELDGYYTSGVFTAWSGVHATTEVGLSCAVQSCDIHLIMCCANEDAVHVFTVRARVLCPENPHENGCVATKTDPTLTQPSYMFVAGIQRIHTPARVTVMQSNLTRSVLFFGMSDGSVAYLEAHALLKLHSKSLSKQEDAQVDDRGEDFRISLNIPFQGEQRGVPMAYTSVLDICPINPSEELVEHCVNLVVYPSHLLLWRLPEKDIQVVFVPNRCDAELILGVALYSVCPTLPHFLVLTTQRNLCISLNNIRHITEEIRLPISQRSQTVSLVKLDSYLTFVATSPTNRRILIGSSAETRRTSRETKLSIFHEAPCVSISCSITNALDTSTLSPWLKWDAGLFATCQTRESSFEYLWHYHKIQNTTHKIPALIWLKNVLPHDSTNSNNACDGELHCPYCKTCHISEWYSCESSKSESLPLRFNALEVFCENRHPFSLCAQCFSHIPYETLNPPCRVCHFSVCHRDQSCICSICGAPQWV